MASELVTGNHAAGYALSVAGEANREALGTVCGIYPITPQTEIVEYVAKFPFTKGRVVPVESEHSAMGVSIGASLSGARAFTASAANGLTYMTENIMVAGFYRLPVVTIAVNRTLGPPWNIWADQSDSLALRDFPLIQFYCESNQEVLDTTLLAFRLGEDHRILLPAIVCMDAFLMSHTQMRTELPEQDLVDRYLPLLDLPHRIRHERPTAVGGLVWPEVATSQRLDIDEAMARVGGVLEECRSAFQEVFDRDVGGAIEVFGEDADTFIVVSGTIVQTAREVVRQRREAGEKLGMIKVKMYRPFPEDELRRALAGAKKVGVLDRNYAAGVGGIFWWDLRAAFQGRRDDLMLQGYITGLCGSDVTPELVHQVIDNLNQRTAAEPPVWMGIDR